MARLAVEAGDFGRMCQIHCGIATRFLFYCHRMCPRLV